MGSDYKEIATKVFRTAVDLPPGEREAFLAKTCAEDPALRSEVDALLRASETTRRDEPSPALPQEAVPSEKKDRPEAMIGRHIGPYCIMRRIGQGGMGSVYLAMRDDQEFQKQVVVKLVKRGMDSEALIRRFRMERQILASLDQPNIARLLDGGTTEEGLPYFVMEYVDGTAIDVYCDTHRLSTIARLRLFLTVCSAIHAAHQSLIVHRDIKPNNILVTSEGVPKLLDFGIAKLLDAGSFPSADITTAPDERPMTPAYASPEQIRGEPITTSSDIYSLGILLYQLLTGHRPYRFKSQQRKEVERVVCEVEPEKPSEVISRVEEDVSSEPSGTLTPDSVSSTREGEPSKLRRRLAGDLDNIVLMAIRKEAQRRYASVHQFAEDIERYLSGRPVIARDDTWTYRTSKFIQRHKKGTISSLFVLLSLIAAILGTGWEAHSARIQKARADRRFEDVRKLANSFMFEIHDAVDNLPGATLARELLVNKALEYLDSLSQEAGADLSLKRELAIAYRKVGDIQGNPYYANRGDRSEAMKNYQKSMGLLTEISRMNPEDIAARRDLAEGHGRLAEMLRATGGIATALEHARTAMALWGQVVAHGNGEESDRQQLAMSYDTVGEFLAQTGDAAGGISFITKALDLRKALVKENHSPENLRYLAINFGKLGNALWMTNDSAGAMDNYGKAAILRVQLVAGDPMNSKLQRELSASYIAIGDALWAGNEMAAALRNYHHARMIREELLAADNNDAQARRDLAIIYGNLSSTLVYTGDSTGALEFLKKSLALFQELADREPKSLQAKRDLSLSHATAGDMFMEKEDPMAALDHYRQALALLAGLAESDVANAVLQYQLAGLHFRIGETLKSLASDTRIPPAEQRVRWREARTSYAKSLEVWQAMAKRGQVKERQQERIKEVSTALARCDTALMGKQLP